MQALDLRSAASLLERGDYDAARVVLESLVENDHGYAAAHVLLAKIAENQSRFEDALDNWERAYLINPLSTEISISYEYAVLRSLLPNPAIGPVREISERSSQVATTNSVSATDELRSGGELGAVERDTASGEASDSDAVSGGASDSNAENGGDPEDTIVLDDELDRLIDELDAARIVPDPDIETISEAELSTNIDDVVSETLARIYASQNYFSEAGEVYEKLALQQPARKDEFVEKAADMHTRSVARN